MSGTPQSSHDALRTTRRYDSPLRRERAAQTRERIVDAGAELAHELSSWDWRAMTIRAVAERAGVHERTVYRHFPTERVLRAAVLARLVEEAGLTPEDFSLTTLDAHVSTLFRYLSSFASTTSATDEPFAALDERRKAGILTAVAAAAPDWPEPDRRVTAAMIDVLWGVATYQRLVTGWGLDAEEATRAATWVLELLAGAVRDGHRPPLPSGSY